MRTDTILHGAVECDGSQYNFTDFPDIKNLLDEGKLPYLPIDKFDSMVTNQGVCGSFGWDNVPNNLYAWTQRSYTVYTKTLDLIDGQEVELYDSQGNLSVYSHGIYLAETNSIDRQDAPSGPLRLTRYPTKDILSYSTTYFKVPKLSNIFIESGTNTNIGNYVEVGLPNITGSIKYAAAVATSGISGAFQRGSTTVSENSGGGSGVGDITFDASRCSPIYGNSTTVQPPAVLYRTMIQLKN